MLSIRQHRLGTCVLAEGPMALRSNLWSSETLEGGLALARMATLGIENDPDVVSMTAELKAAGV